MNVNEEVSSRRDCIGRRAEGGWLVERDRVHSLVSCMIIPAPRLGGASAKTSEE